MELKRLTGAHASALKYDVLTALSLCGLHGSQTQMMSMIRLTAVVTARYNWRRDELSIGQRDMARLWGVTERTAKREVRRWLESGLLVCTRPGVRGRVAAYRLDIRTLLEQSRDLWDLVGPDYAERMGAERQQEAAKVVKVDFGAGRSEPDPQEQVTPPGWRAASARFREMSPQVYASWIAPLTFVSDDGRTVTLRGPSAFASRYVETHHARELAEVVDACIGPMRRVVIEAP